MAFWDWLIIGGYLVTAVVIGAYFTKKASQSTTDFFLAGRSLPWFIAGTSMVATTFSAETPILVSGLTRGTGIFENWFWWSGAIGGAATVFYFARLWRRTEVLTDIEFITKRYEASAPNNALRLFKVLYYGLMGNCLGIATITVAMTKIISNVIDLPEGPLFTLPIIGIDVPAITIILVVLGLTALAYSSLSGMYGIVYTDLLQFTLAMVGSISLAVIAYVKASGGDGLMANLQAARGFDPHLLNFVPDLSVMNIATFTFFVYLFVAWWSNAPGDGPYVQRILSCKTEKDSLLAYLWFNLCHFIIRPWPWIIVAIISLIYLPDLQDPETAFPAMIRELLPVGLKGVMVAAMLAAFMSTLDTLLNWGTSYLVNDLYQPYIVKNASSKHYVVASRVGMLVMAIVALLVASQLESIVGVAKYWMVIIGPLGTVMIARWYWWRVNPWSEISAMAASLIFGNLLTTMGTISTKLAWISEEEWLPLRILIAMVSVTLSWVVVTLLTSREPCAQTIVFYRKMRIGGPGWKKIAQITDVQPIKGELKNNTIAWISCVTFIYSLLFGTGYFLFHNWSRGGICLGVSIVSGFVLAKMIGKMKFSD